MKNIKVNDLLELVKLSMITHIQSTTDNTSMKTKVIERLSDTGNTSYGSPLKIMSDMPDVIKDIGYGYNKNPESSIGRGSESIAKDMVTGMLIQNERGTDGYKEKPGFLKKVEEGINYLSSYLKNKGFEPLTDEFKEAQLWKAEKQFIPNSKIKTKIKSKI